MIFINSSADLKPLVLFIYLLQVENEYNHVQLAYKEKGDSYVKWAANLVTGLNLDIPWVMCKQNDAPDPVVSL